MLHFSHALYRHITQDHKLPLLLLLNKCDLIPAAAATAWQQWLQQQLLGAITVIPVSAAKENAGATARAVLTALLQLQVQREGGSSSDSSCQVQDLVGLDLGESGCSGTECTVQHELQLRLLRSCLALCSELV